MSKQYQKQKEKWKDQGRQEVFTEIHKLIKKRKESYLCDVNIFQEIFSINDLINIEENIKEKNKSIHTLSMVL